MSHTDQDLVGVSELCRALGISRGTFNRRLRLAPHLLPPMIQRRPKAHWHCRRRDLDQFLARRRAEQAELIPAAEVRALLRARGPGAPRIRVRDLPRPRMRAGQLVYHWPAVLALLERAAAAAETVIIAPETRS
jgi:hypothetical protein